MPRLVFGKRFKKRFAKKQAPKQAAILKCVHLLGSNPRHQSLETHKVKSEPGVFEAYIDRANRVTWEYGDDCIILRNHCNHDIVKRSP